MPQPSSATGGTSFLGSIPARGLGPAEGEFDGEGAVVAAPVEVVREVEQEKPLAHKATAEPTAHGEVLVHLGDMAHGVVASGQGSATSRNEATSSLA